MESNKSFFKNNASDTVWWVDTPDEIGLLEVSFDKKTIYDLWTDYPQRFTEEQKRVFDKENPYWAKFFADRT